MGLRPKPLFWAERIEEKRQSERDLIGTGGKIDELYKVIEFRPNIKVMKYLPAADEMDAIKNENIHDGFLIIFDTMPDDVTDLFTCHVFYGLSVFYFAGSVICRNYVL